ncbi:MAG: hypothetical protein J6B85_04950 [Lachnospiraceae bacterium]|nr:hypothetical protein [Lachnospiraceae bacterium]
MKKIWLTKLFPKKVIQIGTATPGQHENAAAGEESVWDDLKEEEKEESDENPEYEIVEREIRPQKIICPDCGGITLEGLDFCDKCGGELTNDSRRA